MLVVRRLHSHILETSASFPMRLLPCDDHRARIDGSALEKLAYEFLLQAGHGLTNFRVNSQELVQASDGLYRIDVTVRFEQLGVDFLVLVECKDHSRPVEREDIQILHDKMRSASAQKGILFATNGFQRGAMDYAKAHRIALVRILEGRLIYETKSLASVVNHRDPPPSVRTQAFVGQYIEADGDSICVTLLEHGRTDSLTDFFRAQ